MAEHKDPQSGQATEGIESGDNRPSHPAQPDEIPLTLGSNGGGRGDNQPAGTDSGRTPRGTEVHSEQRKAS